MLKIRPKSVRRCGLLPPLDIIWPGAAECNRALADFTAYHFSPRLGLLDALIGARAFGHGATLCTFNAKHYRAIAGIKLEQPYAR